MNRNYWKFFSASAVTNLGDGVATVAYPWLATLITRDPFLISLVVVATRLPWLLFALPAGVIIDRYNRKRLIIGADIFRFLLTLVVVFVAMSMDTSINVSIHLPLLCGAAFLLGIAEVLRDNAAQTLLPSIVPASQLPKANGWMWAAENITNSFIGPPLAGLLLAVALPLPFLLDAVTFGLAVLLVSGVMIAPRIKVAPEKPLHAMKSGFAWLWRRRALRDLAIVLGLMNAAYLAGFTVLVLLAQEVLQLDATAYGLLLTGGAVGAVIGGVIAGWVTDKLGQRATLLAAVFVMFLADVAIAVTHSTGIVWAVTAASGLAAILWNVVTVSLRQRVIPDHLLGRVNSVYRFFGWGMMPVGALIGGAVVAALEGSLGREAALRVPFLLAAMINLAIFAYLFATLTQKSLSALEQNNSKATPV